MINSLKELITTLTERWLEEAQPDMAGVKVRAYLNGRYVIEDVRVSQDDGAIVLWLDERGDPR